MRQRSPASSRATTAQVGMKFAAGAVVARDDAGDRCLFLDRRSNPQGDLAPRPKPAPSGGVVNLDRDGAHPEQVAFLPDPGELLLRRSAQPPKEDLAQGVALAIVATLVHVQVEVPRRGGLVVVVSPGEDHPEPG